VYLASLSFSRQAHYQSSLVYNYGRTEDIPYGFLFTLAGGREYNEMYNRPYAGVSASTGYFVPFLGYLSHEATCGTFFRNGRTEQGSLDVYTDYISNLVVAGRFKQRIFVSAQYSAQLNNRLKDHLNISGDTGIPGFRNDSVYGRHRLNLSLEFNLFSPWDIRGFRMVWYASANFCWLNDYENFFRQNTLYSSFGFGIRIRNERLIIKTLQLQVSFFPNIPKNSSFRYVRLSKESVLRPRQFTAKAPEVVSLY
jgi:outer membrane protein assembly factor BamA